MKPVICQGDVTFVPAEYFTKEFLDKFTKKKEDGVLAYGEVSGHSHRPINGKFDLMVMDHSDRSLDKMLLSMSAPTTITHEEHEEFDIYGNYIVVIQQEVDHFEKTLRRVAD